MQKSRKKDSPAFGAGQTAMEYLLLLGIMVVIALTAFRNLLPQAYIKTNQHFNIALINLAGPPPSSFAGLGGPFP